MTRMGTMKMTPQFMKELDDMDEAHNPEFKGHRSYMSVTTDGSDVSREEVEAQVRKWVQARIEGKCKMMESFQEDPRPRRTAAEMIETLRNSAKVTKKVRRGCPNKGNLCGCLGVCQDIISVPLNDPRQNIEEYPL